MKRYAVCLLMFMFVVLISFTVPAFALQDDGVLSQHIMEADGTSGQDTSSGSGVKTGHIQDDAVTTSKIADNAVTTSKIADGAVTDAKIAGPISASKISSTGLDADTVDGLNASDLQKKYDNVIVVSKDGKGDFTDPLAAMNSITDASENNGYLIKVMPGVYELAGVLVVKDYVDIEGSGKEVTKITTQTWGSYCGTLCYITGVDHAELRDITVESYQPTPYIPGDITAIPVGISSNATFTNVRLQALGAGYNYGISVQAGGTPLMKNVEIIADPLSNPYSSQSYGVSLNDGASITITDSTVKAYGNFSNCNGIRTYMPSSVTLINSDVYGEMNGLDVRNATITAHNSRISGGLRAVYVELGGDSFYGAGSQIDGAIYGSGTFKCINCYDGNFDAVP